MSWNEVIELIERAKTGDRSAYGELVHIYQAERLRRSRNIWLGSYVQRLLDEPG